MVPERSLGDGISSGLQRHSSRKEYGENCAASARSCATSDGDPATVLVDDTFRQPQAKASTGIFFGGEKGLEDAITVSV